MEPEKLRSCTTLNKGMEVLNQQFEGIDMKQLEEKIKATRLQSFEGMVPFFLVLDLFLLP